jgi:hypothetical protein
MFRIITLILGLGISGAANADTKFCLNLFTFTTLAEEFDFTSIYSAQNTVSVNQNGPKNLIVGHADLLAKKIGTLQTRQIANLDYTVRGDFLTITSARIPTEFTGDGVYRQLLEKILADNPNVKILMTSLSGKYYEEYLKNLESVSAMEFTPADRTLSDVAVALGSVFGELQKLGFTQVRSSVIVEGYSGPFVRFSVQR